MKSIINNFVNLMKEDGFEETEILFEKSVKTKFREIVETVIFNFNIKKSCEKQIVEIIIDNCLS